MTFSVIVVSRIIPAYAGSTAPCTSTRPSRADHPRIRGEHTPTRTETSGASGSSPHTRGARGFHAASVVDQRIIPAYAGSTLPRDRFRDDRQDHPRIRGEHPMKRGSSSATTRIIPAYAGSTWMAS